MTQKQFYTYLHCKPDGIPFYVGKGSGNRAYNLYSRNKFHKSIVAKYGILVYVFECYSEQQAFLDEISQIAQLRKEGFVLTNITSGGEGTGECRLGKKHSEATKKILSLKARGRTWAEGRKKAFSEMLLGKPSGMAGKIHSEETKARIKSSCTGKKRTAEQSAAQSKRQLGLPHPQKETTCPYCCKVGRACLMTRFHFDNCKQKNDNRK